MTPMEADIEAEYLAKFFPVLKREAVIYWAREFERHDTRDVREAIERVYAESKDVNLSAAALFNLINAAKRKRLDHESADRRQGNQSARAKVQEMDATIAALSDKDLAELKEIVLACSTAALRKLLEKKDPRKSVILAGMICRHLETTGACGR